MTTSSLSKNKGSVLEIDINISSKRDTSSIVLPKESTIIRSSTPTLRLRVLDVLTVALM